MRIELLGNPFMVLRSLHTLIHLILIALLGRCCHSRFADHGIKKERGQAAGLRTHSQQSLELESEQRKSGSRTH